MQEFAGQWVVEPDPSVRDGRSLGATKLRYEISVVPNWPIPSSVVSHLVKAGLPANITAIAERAEEVRLCLYWHALFLVLCAVPSIWCEHTFSFQALLSLQEIESRMHADAKRTV